MENTNLTDSRCAEIGKRIKELRTKAIFPIPDEYTGKRMTQDIFSKLIGIKREKLIKIEHGNKPTIENTSLRTFFNIADLCGCDVGYILGEYVSNDHLYTTRQLSDISEQLPLSPVSINVLKLFSDNIDNPNHDGFIRFLDELLHEESTCEGIGKSFNLLALSGDIQSMFEVLTWIRNMLYTNHVHS